GAVAGRLVELGCPRVIVPWMPEADRATTADVRAFASELGESAPRVADDGIGLGYHNHDFEFAVVEGSTIWDTLLGALPSARGLQLDGHEGALERGRACTVVLRGCGGGTASGRRDGGHRGPHPDHQHERPRGRRDAP